jgi:hypothetical protein
VWASRGWDEIGGTERTPAALAMARIPDTVGQSGRNRALVLARRHRLAHRAAVPCRPLRMESAKVRDLPVCPAAAGVTTMR